jgi:hypothetical protein
MWFHSDGTVTVRYGYTADSVLLTAEPVTIVDTPGHDVLTLNHLASLTDQVPDVFIVDTASDFVLEADLTGEVEENILKDTYHEMRTKSKEQRAPVVEQQQPYQLTPEQEFEQTALWTSVLTCEARRISKKQPISSLRTYLKKLRRDAPLSKSFTRKVLKIVITKSDEWLAYWVSDIAQAAISQLEALEKADSAQDLITAS